MEEATQLCDRVAIIDHGRIVALDSPANLVASPRGGEPGRVHRPQTPIRRRFRALQGVTCVERDGGPDRGLRTRATISSSGSSWPWPSRKIRFRDLRTEQPTLEDVFLAMTGTAMRE